MTSNATKKRPAPGKERASNANTENHTACRCAAQAIPITRKDIFAAVALHGLITAAADRETALALCAEDGPATASACYIIAARMEVAARAEIGGTR